MVYTCVCSAHISTPLTHSPSPHTPTHPYVDHHMHELAHSYVHILYTLAGVLSQIPMTLCTRVSGKS